MDYKTLTGKHFTVDACHSNGGVSSHCPVFHSPAKSFLCGDVCGERVWLSPPVARVDRVVKHYLKCKSGSPHNTSACIVVPAFTVQSGADCCKACGCQNNMLTVLCCLQRLVMVVVKCWRLRPGTTKCMMTPLLLGLSSLLEMSLHATCVMQDSC